MVLESIETFLMRQPGEQPWLSDDPEGEHFAAARKAHDIPKTININHLKAPGASPRRPVKR